jgi:hypothetical protein
MSLRFTDKDVTSISDFVAKLDANGDPDQVLWFRGHARASWNLQPSVARNSADPVEAEWVAFKRFRQNAARFIQQENPSEWDWMFLMQHYGVKTRLLDWSENPLVALYFAVCEHMDEDGHLWVLLPAELNKKGGFASKLTNDLPCFQMDDELDAYLTKSVRINYGAAQNPIAAIASRNSSRIVAQHGVFTVFHSGFSPLEDIYDGQHLWRYRIPKEHKERIKKELGLLQINKFTLFPELGNAGEVANLYQH